MNDKRYVIEADTDDDNLTHDELWTDEDGYCDDPDCDIGWTHSPCLACGYCHCRCI